MFLTKVSRGEERNRRRGLGGAGLPGAGRAAVLLFGVVTDHNFTRLVILQQVVRVEQVAAKRRRVRKKTRVACDVPAKNPVYTLRLLHDTAGTPH